MQCSITSSYLDMSCVNNPLDDIEDIIGQNDDTSRDRYAGRNHIVPKVKRKKVEKRENDFVEPVIADSVIPGINYKDVSLNLHISVAYINYELRLRVSVFICDV